MISEPAAVRPVQRSVSGAQHHSTHHVTNLRGQAGLCRRFRLRFAFRLRAGGRFTSVLRRSARYAHLHPLLVDVPVPQEQGEGADRGLEVQDYRLRWHVGDDDDLRNPIETDLGERPPTPSSLLPKRISDGSSSRPTLSAQAAEE